MNLRLLPDLLAAKDLLRTLTPVQTGQVERLIGTFGPMLLGLNGSSAASVNEIMALSSMETSEKLLRILTTVPEVQMRVDSFRNRGNPTCPHCGLQYNLNLEED